MYDEQTVVGAPQSFTFSGPYLNTPSIVSTLPLQTLLHSTLSMSIAQLGTIAQAVTAARTNPRDPAHIVPDEALIEKIADLQIILLCIAEAAQPIEPPDKYVMVQATYGGLK